MPQRARSRQSHLKDCRKPSKPQFVGERVSFAAAFSEVSRGVKKFKQNEYAEYGAHPIVDQGQELIAGYSDDETGLFNDVPAIVFGDHTRCVKYVEEPFFAGADGVKILKPRLSDNARFWWHELKATPIENLGYSRHFKLLKAATFKTYDTVSQTEIVVRLDSILDQIAQANQQIEQLDQLVKSRFIEIFGDSCDPGSSSAKNRIDSFCELRIGPFGSALHKEDYITGGHPLVNPSHIIGGAIRPDENLTIDDGKYESLAAYHLLPGDTVLGRRGEIGRCAVVKTDGLICGTGSMIIRPGQKVRSDYLQRVVSFPSFSHALEANAVGVTMKNLNAKIVGSAEAFLPDLKDQDAFITLVSQIDK